MNPHPPVRDVPPPPALRAAVLAAALAHRPAGYPDPEALPASVAPFAAEVDKLEALLREVTEAQWRQPVPAAGTTVRGLVDHLSANDAALAEALGVLVPDSGRDGPPHAVWRARVQGLLRHALTDPLERRVELIDGLPLPAGAAYLARAFETWIHADDIRGALGRAPRPPIAEHLAPLADLHVRSLPAALAVSGRARSGRSAEVCLTGPGGATWRIPMAPGEPAGPPDVTLTADVLDYCYAAGSRRSPATVPSTVTGDPALAADLLAALSAFSDD